MASSPRGIGTLIGNGWLREAPRNAWPREWDIRGRSALRKCHFLPLPEYMKRDAPPGLVAPNRVATPRPQDIPASVRRRDPKKDARMIPAMSPEMFARPQQRPHPMAVAHVGGSARAWYEDPLALGSLLILMPPMGLAVLWTSKRYSNDARWALTVMTALTMCLGAAVFLAALALR